MPPQIVPSEAAAKFMIWAPSLVVTETVAHCFARLGGADDQRSLDQIALGHTLAVGKFPVEQRLAGRDDRFKLQVRTPAHLARLTLVILIPIVGVPAWPAVHFAVQITVDLRGS